MNPEFATAKDGKFDDLCQACLMATHSELSVLLLIGGPMGPGFSVTATDPEHVRRIPQLLRSVADDIERQNAEGKVTMEKVKL